MPYNHHSIGICTLGIDSLSPLLLSPLRSLSFSFSLSCSRNLPSLCLPFPSYPFILALLRSLSLSLLFDFCPCFLYLVSSVFVLLSPPHFFPITWYLYVLLAARAKRGKRQNRHDMLQCRYMQRGETVIVVVWSHSGRANSNNRESVREAIWPRKSENERKARFVCAVRVFCFVFLTQLFVWMITWPHT